MVHNRRPLVCLAVLMLMTISLTGCGPDESRQPARGAAVPPSSRDAILNERLSALQNRIAQLDHQISQATVTSRLLNEELTALRQELAAGTAQRPAAAEAPAAPVAPAPAVSPAAPAVSAPPQSIQPVISQPAPPVPLPSAEKAPASKTRNPIFWILVIAIVVVAFVFIVKLAMGPWSEEEDSDWIEEGVPSEDEEDQISLSPETGEKPETQTQEPGDEPKP
ncbi:MAG: hypothetical protein ABFD69_03665 [Candidatus Sumerlaeia bacterium]